MSKIIIDDPDSVVYRLKATNPFPKEVLVDTYEIPPYAQDFPVAITLARKLELEKDGWKFKSNSGDSSGGIGNPGDGSRKSKTLTPESPGVEDMGEGGFWYTLTADDAEYMITVLGINRINLPTAKEYDFPLHTHVTLFTDDYLLVFRREYEDVDADETYESRLYKAGGNDGNEHYEIPGTSVATLILYMKDEEDFEDRWMISGPGLDVYSGE